MYTLCRHAMVGSLRMTTEKSPLKLHRQKDKDKDTRRHTHAHEKGSDKPSKC